MSTEHSISTIVNQNMTTSKIASTQNKYAAQFLQFKSNYSKSYANSTVEMGRFQKFSNNLAIIDELNSGSNSFKLGINKFADLVI